MSRAGIALLVGLKSNGWKSVGKNYKPGPVNVRNTARASKKRCIASRSPWKASFQNAGKLVTKTFISSRGGYLA